MAGFAAWDPTCKTGPVDGGLPSRCTDDRETLALAAPASASFVSQASLVAALPRDDTDNDEESPDRDRPRCGEALLKPVRDALVDHVIKHGSGSLAWVPLLEEVGVRARNSPAQCRAVLSSGAKESQFGDELEVAAWVFPERLPELLKHPARLESTLALHWAAAANRGEAVSLLLSAGVDVNGQTSGHWAECVSIRDPWCTALVAAAWANALEAAKLLVESGAAIEPADKDETPAVHVAARRGSLDVLKFLVEKGADFNREFGVRDFNKRDAFECAVDAQADDCARFLIESGAKVSVHKLLRLIKHGHGSFDVTEALALLELMISRGADVNHCEYQGQRRPILSAIELGDPRIVEALIQAGALGADEATTREAFKMVSSAIVIVIFRGYPKFSCVLNTVHGYT
jgi:hypothetical protein